MFTKGVFRIALLIISLEIFLTWIVLIHAQPQLVYCNFVKFQDQDQVHMLGRGCTNNTFGQTGHGDSYLTPPPKKKKKLRGM